MMTPKDETKPAEKMKTVAELLAEAKASGGNGATPTPHDVPAGVPTSAASNVTTVSAETPMEMQATPVPEEALLTAETTAVSEVMSAETVGTVVPEEASSVAEQVPVSVEGSGVVETPAPADADAPGDSEAHPVVLIRDLKKRIGSVQALDGVNLALLQGHVLGLLGPNGSGKTTLLRILAGLAHPTSGRVEIDGMTPGIETKKIVSYLPDRQFLPDDMTVERARAFFSKFFLDFDQARFDELTERLKLPRKTKLVRLSKGFRDRLTISLVMSRRARLYLLDEPLGGVDPVVREEVMDILIEAMGQDATLLITTHQVRDLERIFDEVCFLREGKVVQYGPAEVVREEAGADLDAVYRRIYE